MKITDIPLPAHLLEAMGITELNPPQAAAVKAGLLDGKSLVVASPTASGKTLIAELAIIRNYLNGGKALYLVPLRALASEKYEDFKKKYEQFGIRVAISIGDFDSAGEWLGRYDVVIATNEKVDSMIRHGATWLRNVTLIVADEIHSMGDPGRGPTLEIVLTRLRHSARAQILALSATIANSDEIADWLGAKVVKSDYRPVKLYRGVSYPKYDEKDSDATGIKIDLEGRDYVVDGNEREPEISLCRDTIERGKQALVFLSTRRSTEAVAERAGKKLAGWLKPDEQKRLSEIAREVEGSLSSATKQCRRLGQIVRTGAAFHHAGLVAKQRQAIEEGFRSGLIKVLTATPTLAFGVNLPSWRVLIRDVKRYGGMGAEFIPALEVQQMMGRAGRPRYDTEGEAIIIAKSQDEAEELRERYVNSDPEPIESQLSSESVLRMHTLALIADGIGRTRSGLLDFFSKTFFGYQEDDFKKIEKILEKILHELELWKFIESEGGKGFISDDFRPAFELSSGVSFQATRLGKRVAQLYIDPYSAHQIIQGLVKDSDLSYLMTICRCSEMQPSLRLKREDYEDLGEMLASSSELHGVPDVWDVEYQGYLEAFKTAMMIFAWMDETSEEKLLERFGLPPGELYTRMTNAEWLLYAGKELAMVLGRRSIGTMWNRLVLRAKHGVKEELLPLVAIRGIGRARGRKLWKAGVRTPTALRKVPEKRLAEILGPRVAIAVRRELGKTKSAGNISENANEQIL